MEAENQKAESGREHQKRATLFTAAEQKVQQMEEQLKRQIIKSRPYFDEKALCQEQLNTQKERIESLKKEICKVKSSYSRSLKELEHISNEIHMKRKGLTAEEVENEMLNRPREPGVGAELTNSEDRTENTNSFTDFNLELDKCELRSVGSCSGTVSSAVSERDENECLDVDSLDELKLKVKELAIRPIEGGEGKCSDAIWESELKDTVDKLDHMMMMQECKKDLLTYKTELTFTPNSGNFKTELSITSTVDNKGKKLSDERDVGDIEKS